MERTSSYKFTITSKSDSRLAELRTQIKESNKSKPAGKKEYVKCQARLGKNNPYASLYAKGGPLYRWILSIKPEHAARFDVYVYQRYEWN
jgi:hypothetical protein